MAPIPAYMDSAALFRADPGYGEHVALVLAQVAHRLTCPKHFAALTGGSSDDADWDRAIDAQADLVIAAYGGDSRIALVCAIQALGHAAVIVGSTLREDEL
jgi:hypothetical protein